MPLYSWIRPFLPCCLPLRDQSNPARSPSDSHGKAPPQYSQISPSTQPIAQRHAQSCRVLGEWDKLGDASTNYMYEVWVLPKACLGEPAYNGQIQCLDHCLQLQKIHKFDVNVRCILRIPPRDSQDTELDVYNDIMAAETMGMIHKSWGGRKRGSSRVTSTQSNSLATIDDDINSIIDKSRNSDSEFKKAKDELLHLLLAKLAKSQKGWSLNEFCKRKDEILDEEDLFQCNKHIAVLAQFRLQAVSAFQASDGPTSQAMYTLNFVPETVANSTYQAVRSFFAPADMALRCTLQIRNKKGRSDSYCLKLVSFGTGDKSEGGAQWQEWDDARRGDEDRTDHTFINANRLTSAGPGHKLGEQLLLAAASSHLDRTSRKKTTDDGLYGDRTAISIPQWKDCLTCRNFAAV